MAAKLRPGNGHRGEDWDELLLPEIERQQAEGKQVTFRADAAFAIQYELRVNCSKNKYVSTESCVFTFLQTEINLSPLFASGRPIEVSSGPDLLNL